MKNFNLTRFITSLLLLVIISAFIGSLAFSYGKTGIDFSTVAFVAAIAMFAIGFIKGLIAPGDLKGYAFDLVISDTTYAGEVASQFIVKALTGAETILGGHIYVKDGINKKYTIPRFGISNLIQDRAATPSSQGSMNVDGRVLNPLDYMVYMEFNPRDFEDHWYASQLNPTLLDRSLPNSVESVMIQEAMKFHANYFDRAIWQNSLVGSAPFNKFDGLITKGVADTDVIDVASPVTLTAANIADKFELGYLLVPNAILYNPNLKIFVSYKTAKLYQAFQQSQTYKGVDLTSRGIMAYKGINVVPIAGFPDDTFLIAVGTADVVRSNLWVGINSKTDNTIQLARLQANSELFFIKMLFKADTQIGFGEEAVLYKV